MKLLKFKFLLLFSSSFFLFDNLPLLAECNTSYCKNLNYRTEKNILNNELFSRKISLEPIKIVKINGSKGNSYFDILETNINQLFNSNKFLTNLTNSSSETLKKDKSFNQLYEIESNIQFIQNDVFFAEGDVNILLKKGNLKADKIEYDRNKKILKVKGNLQFKKGEQYFNADYLEYDLNRKKGYIDNVYGVLSFDSIDKDLNFKDNLIQESVCISDEDSLLNLPSQIALLGSSNVRLKNKIGLDSLKLNFSSIKKWRFKSNKINLLEKGFQSDLIFFTNDPFNKAQFLLKSKDFTGKLINDKTEFKSQSTSLIFDDKLTLPIGKRTIRDEKVGLLKWGVGYEYKDKDGLYIMRNFESFKFGEKFNLDVQPYFLLQRSINGKSNAFKEKGSTFFSDNIKSNISFLDYFALDAKLKGKIVDWSSITNFELKTLNPERFYDNFAVETNLVRNLYNYSRFDNQKGNLNCGVKSNYDKTYEKFSVNYGLYGIYDKDEISSAYGNKIYSDYKYIKNKLTKNYSLIFDFGEYDAKSKKDNDVLIKLSRYGVISSFENLYQILNFDKNPSIFNKEFRYTPETVKQGLFFRGKIGNGIYSYGNGDSQSIISIGLGPKLVYGNLKNKFFDYTNISIGPEFIYKRSQSPFTFDDFNDTSRINFDLQQQIYGPIMFGYKGVLNINSNSSDYGKFEDKSFSLGLKRRAYEINLSYDPKDKITFLGLEIFSFNYKKFSPKF